MWVYQIGISTNFENIAPGEVTDLPPDAAPGGHEELAVPKGPVYTDGQTLTYPQYEPDAGEIEVHAVQYQPENPQVIEVDQPDINVDGECLMLLFKRMVLAALSSLLSVSLVFSYNFGTCANNRNKCSQFADCRDYVNGFCCNCRPGFYGNGNQCVAEGTARL